MRQQQVVIFDAWMQEVVEAKQLAEEIESRIKDRDSMTQANHGYCTDHANHGLTTGRRKLMLLGTQLDRLESLLHNPPVKPILSERDLQNRKDLILDLRQRTKQMALSLSTLQSSKRINVHDGDANLQSDMEKATNPNNSDINCSQRKNMEDKEPVCSKVTETDKNHMAITVEEETNLQSPLLNSVDKDGDANQSLHGVENGSDGSRRFDSCQLTINLFLIIVAIVLLSLIIVAVIESF